MKKIPLTVTTHTIQGKEYPLDYREQYIALITGSQEGFSYEQMRRVNTVYDKLTAAEAGSYVLLEDAEHDVLKARLADPKFTVFTKQLFEMCTACIEAPEHLAELENKSA